MNEHFTWRRLGLLIRNDFVNGLRSYLTAFTVISIIMMLNAIPSAGFGELRDDLYDGWFAGLIFIWGSIHASLMLNELGNKKLNEGYLLLPASALEKTLARYLHGSIFFIFYILVFTTLAALIIEGINQLLFSRSNDLFNPFSATAWEMIGFFMIVQPIYFLGGAWFRSARWFKTVISIFIICAVLGLLACLAFFIFFPDVVSGMIQGHGFVVNDDINWQVNEDLFAGVVIGLKVLCFVIAPLFCCYLTWLRVKETQVSHGI